MLDFALAHIDEIWAKDDVVLQTNIFLLCNGLRLGLLMLTSVYFSLKKIEFTSLVAFIVYCIFALTEYFIFYFQQ